MLRRSLAFLLTAASLVFADLKVTSPSGGNSFEHDGIKVGVSGADSKTQIQVFLMVGGNKADGSDSTVVYSNTPSPYAGKDIAISVPVGSGPATAFNGYYIKVMGTPAGGTPSFAFSHRFKMTDMTGGWASDAIKSAAQTAAKSGDDSVPADVAGAAAAANPAAAGSVSNIAYSLQSGTIKYAPMQSKPGTTITKTNTAPLYPTSAWSVYTTGAPIPKQISTQTASNTASASSRENTANPVAKPTGDMAKFLARWVD